MKASTRTPTANAQRMATFLHMQEPTRNPDASKYRCVGAGKRKENLKVRLYLLITASS